MGLVQKSIPLRETATGALVPKDSVPLGVSVGDALRNRDFDNALAMQYHLRIKEDNLPKELKWKTTSADIALEACKIPEQDGDYSLASLVQLIAGWLKDQEASFKAQKIKVLNVRLLALELSPSGHSWTAVLQPQ